MKKETVVNFIDRKIHQSMVDGLSILGIQQEIEIKYKNMSKVLLQEVICEDEFEEILKGDFENIQPSRIKYTAYYVSHSRKRITDLDWISINRSKFPMLSLSQIFNLVKLKDKLKPNL